MDFSVNSLHSTEKKMQAEITRLLKATKSSSIADLSQSVLENKLLKGPLSEYLSKIVKLLDSSMNLCKAAAGSIDEMKTKVLDTQTQLIECQNNEISSVKEVVQEETKTWADLFKKTNNNVKQSTHKSVKEAIKAGELLKSKGVNFDIMFTSDLFRAQETGRLILEEMDQTDITVVKDVSLNERNYGDLAEITIIPLI